MQPVKSSMQDAQPQCRSLISCRLLCFVARMMVSAFLCLVCVSGICAKDVNDARIEDFEGRQITSIELVFEGSPPDAAAQAEFLSLLKVAPNTEFSAVRVRDSLQSLFDSGRVANARVEVVEEGANKTGPIKLRFVVQRQVQIGDVQIELAPVTGTTISTDELRARLNLTQPGTRLSKQIIVRSADEILVYLRDRGYFNATVEPVEQVDASGTRATVTYKVTPGEQTRVAAFNIDIKGFDSASMPMLQLQPGTSFTRETLASDVKRIRDALINKGYLAPTLDDAQVVRDAERNQVTISLKGAVGPKVNVTLKDYVVSDKVARELLPVKREGNIDFSAIVEGERRLENRLQEEGYFFTEVLAVCTVSPTPAEPGPNGTRETCENLNPASLSGKTVDIQYQVEKGRRL